MTSSSLRYLVWSFGQRAAGSGLLACRLRAIAYCMSFRETLQITTTEAREIIDVTAEVQSVVSRSEIPDGLCVVFVPHTSAAVTVNENADPDVQTDLLAAFEAMVPAIRFRHGEGNSDAHLLATLIGCSVTVPIVGGKLSLGTWQGIWFVELDGPRKRKLEVHGVG